MQTKPLQSSGASHISGEGKVPERKLGLKQRLFDTSKFFHPWFPSYNPQYNQMYDSVVNLGEWEGVAGQPATRVGTITYDSLATFDVRQTDSAIAYIGQHANSNQPFYIEVIRGLPMKQSFHADWCDGYNPLALGPPWRDGCHALRNQPGMRRRTRGI
jgi:hypothetical protein